MDELIAALERELEGLAQSPWPNSDTWPSLAAERCAKAVHAVIQAEVAEAIRQYREETK